MLASSSPSLLLCTNLQFLSRATITNSYYTNKINLSTLKNLLYSQVKQYLSSLCLSTLAMADITQDKSRAEDDEKLREVFRRFLRDAVPYDPRFPNQNQTKNCHQNYMDYFRCVKKKGEDYCAWYKNAYEQLCPPDWVRRWDEQRENGTFPIRDCM